MLDDFIRRLLLPNLQKSIRLQNLVAIVLVLFVQYDFHIRLLFNLFIFCLLLVFWLVLRWRFWGNYFVRFPQLMLPMRITTVFIKFAFAFFLEKFTKLCFIIVIGDVHHFLYEVGWQRILPQPQLSHSVRKVAIAPFRASTTILIVFTELGFVQRSKILQFSMRYQGCLVGVGVLMQILRIRAHQPHVRLCQT